MQTTSLNSFISDRTNCLKVGTDQQGRSIEWDFSQVPNFNICVLGTSGSGKTFTLRQLVHYLVYSGITVHIMDVKDDFCKEKFMLDGLFGEDDRVVCDMDFSYVGGDCGLNVLQFPKTPEAGGVYMAIQFFLEIVHMFNPSFSKKMDSYLTVILQKVYEKKGILHDDIGTWNNPAPVLSDVIEEIESILSHVSLGGKRQTIELLHDLRQRAKKALKDINSPEEKINELKDQLIVEFTQYVNDGLVDDQCDYQFWNLTTLQAIRDTIQSMLNSFIFSRPTLPRQPGKINRYCLSGVSDQHKRILMQIIMSQVFNMSVARTRSTNSFDPNRPSHFLVFDEGKHAKALAHSDLSMFNRIATEGRGYGLGLGIGVQNVNHITHDMVRSFGTQFLLSTPVASHAEVSKNFGAPKHLIKQLIPQNNCLFKGAEEGFSLIRSFR